MAIRRRIYATTGMNEKITELGALEAPYGKQIVLQNVAYENGMRVLRVRIREGNRFTIFDLDDNTTSQLTDLMSDWLDKGNS